MFSERKGEESGLKKIAKSLDKVHADLPGLTVKIALEITAGQGTNLGFRFEQIARIIGMVKEQLILTWKIQQDVGVAAPLQDQSIQFLNERYSRSASRDRYPIAFLDLRGMVNQDLGKFL